MYKKIALFGLLMHPYANSVVPSELGKMYYGYEQQLQLQQQITTTTNNQTNTTNVVVTVSIGTTESRISEQETKKTRNRLGVLIRHLQQEQRAAFKKKLTPREKILIENLIEQ